MNEPEQNSALDRKERVGLSLIALIFFVPAVVLLGILWWLMGSRVTLSAEKKITIGEGQGFLEISSLLEKEHIVKRASLFRVYVLMRGWAGGLEPGTYRFSGSVTIPQVARKIVSGPGDIEVTIPEGFTVLDIDRRLAEQGLTKPNEILTLAQNPERFSFAFLKDEDVRTLEGFLFPDTYRFHQRSTADAIINKMVSNFEHKVVSTIGEGVSANPSLVSVVTLASILEKEVALPEDRPIVSGILWKRLELNMPLQVDATVIYAWRQLNPNWKPKGFALSGAELKINSPYNTYKFPGLPPGPISNPGLEAIKAVLNPTETDYRFYLSTPAGKTIFSKTLEEHNQAKAKYF